MTTELRMDDSKTGDDVRRVTTADGISMSPATFEKIYLTPKSPVSGDLRKTFGNPTPLALLGFIMSLGPFSCDMMGWRGAGGDGASSIGVYCFMGGLIMEIGGVLEFFLGNTYPFVVFCGFGAFWLSFGATLDPSFGAYGDYSTSASDPALGLTTTAFNSGYAFVLLFMGIFCFVCLICALRTNMCLVIIMFGLVLAFCLLAGAFFQVAQGGMAMAHSLEVAGGAFSFVVTLTAIYLFAAQMLLSVGFPIALPVGDLSNVIRSASERKAKEEPNGV